VKSAIERAKRQQLIKKRQVVVGFNASLPMKRKSMSPSKESSGSSHGSNSNYNGSNGSSHGQFNHSMPSPKRKKMNGVRESPQSRQGRDSREDRKRRLKSAKSPKTQNMRKSPKFVNRERANHSPHSGHSVSPNGMRNGGHRVNGMNGMNGQNGLRNGINGGTVSKGFTGKMSVSMQVDSVLKFVNEFQRMLRSQGKIDMQWVEQGLRCMNGLDLETRQDVLKRLVHEARTFNRNELSTSIQQHIVSND